MRRILLLLTVAAMLATMLLALAGPSLAKDTEQKETYIDTVKALQYFAKPVPNTEYPDQRGSWFRGAATDSVEDPDPGLPGQLDTSITYTGGSPSEGGTNTLTGGEWTLCSKGFNSPPLNTTVKPPEPIPPECTPESQIALEGTWIKGEAKWDTDAETVVGEGGDQLTDTNCLPVGVRVYAGIADIEGDLTVTKGGKVNNKPVKEGTGKFEEGKLDHRPLALKKTVAEVPCGHPSRAPIVTGTLKLTF